MRTETQMTPATRLSFSDTGKQQQSLDNGGYDKSLNQIIMSRDVKGCH